MKAEPLTPRESDILKLLCEGYSDREIAERLVLAHGTVKWYNRQIFSKLAVNSRVQACIAARELEAYSSTSGGAPETKLPLALTSFIDRRESIQELSQLLRDNRLITIVGPGGIGKTRLSIEVAKRFLENSHFIPCFVSLAAYSTPQSVPLAIADSLGIPIRAQEVSLQQVVETLSHQPMLLILDNFEHLTDAADTVNRILRSVSDVRLLVRLASVSACTARSSTRSTVCLFPMVRL